MRNQQKVISHQWNDEQDYIIWTYTSYRQSQSHVHDHVDYSKA
jgi:hypothetical protein